MAHLLFLPDTVRPCFFLWGPASEGGAAARLEPELAARGEVRKERVVVESLVASRRTGAAIGLLDAIPVLAAVPMAAMKELPASLGAWSLAAKLALELATRGRFVPRLRVKKASGADPDPDPDAENDADADAGADTDAGAAAELLRATEGDDDASLVAADLEARFRVSLALPADAERAAAIAQHMPLAAHAAPVRGRGAARRKRGAWAPDALLRAFLDASVDAIVRASVALHVGPRLAVRAAKPASKEAPRRPAAPAAAPVLLFRDPRSKCLPADPPLPWELRLVYALIAEDAWLPTARLGEVARAAELDAWARPALALHDSLPRACVRLEMPDIPNDEGIHPGSSTGGFVLRYFLRDRADSAQLVPASEIRSAPRDSEEDATRQHRRAARLDRDLALAARIFEPIARSLEEPSPVAAVLSAEEVWTLLEDGADALRGAGIEVIVPTELTRAGRRRVRVELRIGGSGAAMARKEQRRAAVLGRAAAAGGSARAGVKELDAAEEEQAMSSRTPAAGSEPPGEGLAQERVDWLGALRFRWEVVLDGAALSAGERKKLAELGAPLVPWRGQWAAVDLEELRAVQEVIAHGGGLIPARVALRGALEGRMPWSGLPRPIDVLTGGSFAEALEALRTAGDVAPVEPPASLRVALLPHQARASAWLVRMTGLGLGGCLFEEDGADRRLQAITLCAHLFEASVARAGVLSSISAGASTSTRRSPSAAPPLVIGSAASVAAAQADLARIAPALEICVHHGRERALTARVLMARAEGRAFVLASYDALHVDAGFLSAIDWPVVLLDDVDVLLDPSSVESAAVRRLRAEVRFALVGAPLALRLDALWSLLDLTAPGLLGTLRAFQREIAAPIERFRDPQAEDLLAKLAPPFLYARPPTAGETASS